MLCLAAAVLGVGRIALAQTSTKAVEAQTLRVNYVAPAGCSSRTTFVAELEARTRRVHVVDTTEPVASISVELADHTTGVVGQLRLREPDGTETLRAVAGKTCEEVVPALALIAAVLVDPESVTRGSTAAPALSSTPAPPPPSDGARWRARPSFGIGMSATSTVAPSPSFAPSLELGLEADVGVRRGPLLLVAFERFGSSTVSTPAGLADFSTLLGRVSLCPVRWPSRGLFSLAPCGAFEAGSLHVDVSDSIDESEPSVLWLAAGPGLHLEVHPLRVLGIELELLGIFPLVRDHFYFSPNIPVFSVPVFGWTGRVGIKAVWP
jgi:hypothetical protein